MRRRADHCSETAERCRAQAEYFDIKADSRLHAIRGRAGDRLEQEYRGLAEKFRSQADHFDSEAEQLYEGANAFEVQKWTVIGFAVILAWTLAHAAIMFGAGGAIEAYLATMRTRTALGIASRKLLEYLAGVSARAAAQRGTLVLAGKAALVGVLQGGGINLAVQLKQVAYDQRDEVNRKEVWVATVAGGVGGAAGAAAGKWVGDRWVIPSTLAHAERATGTGGRVVFQVGGAMLIGGVGGLVGGLFGTGAAVALSGEKFTLDAFTESLLPAVTGGFLGAAGYSLASLRAPTPAPESAATGPELGAHGSQVAGHSSRPLTDALDARGPLPAAVPTAQPKTHQQKLNELLSGLLREPGAQQYNSVDWQPQGLVLPDNVTIVKTDTFGPGAESAPAVSAGRDAHTGDGAGQGAYPGGNSSQPLRTVDDAGRLTDGRNAQPAGELHARLLQRIAADESPARPDALKPDKPTSPVVAERNTSHGAVPGAERGLLDTTAHGSVDKPGKPSGATESELNTSSGKDFDAALRQADTGSTRAVSGADETAAAGKAGERPAPRQADGVVVREPVDAPAKASGTKATAEAAVVNRTSPETAPVKASEGGKPPKTPEPAGKPQAYPERPVSAEESGAPPKSSAVKPEPESDGATVADAAAKAAEESAAKPPEASPEEPGGIGQEGDTPKADPDTADDPAAGSRVLPESESAGARYESEGAAGAPGQDPGPDAAELAARYRAEAAVI
ncbi:hypothetical protein, partial [Nocardia jinanensis]